MSETVIQINDLSKSYRLGVIGGKRLADDLNRRWAHLRGKPDPRSKVTQVATGKGSGKNGSSSEEIWALKDISLEVKQGEVLGIIGRNGAGKSTLLKILSRVTAPTCGEVRVKGRIASLLEVGTGFHPELTGRENIFLNGAILGMTKDEIRKKFDEIAAFSEVEQFIDTPVKRYSSGMYVRLAFAVAAHLDSEILIVDEVLAVGDVGFQKKCLGKMSGLRSSGRTVLFVSHNLAAVRSLCSRCLFLSDGKVAGDGTSDEMIDRYTDNHKKEVDIIGSVVRCDPAFAKDVDLNFGDSPRHIKILCGSSLELSFEIQSDRDLQDVAVGLGFLNSLDDPIMSMSSKVQAVESTGNSKKWRVHVDLGRIPLNAGVYHCRIHVSSRGIDIARFTDAMVLEVVEHDVFGWGNAIPAARHWGSTYWAPEWKISPQSATSSQEIDTGQR